MISRAGALPITTYRRFAVTVSRTPLVLLLGLALVLASRRLSGAFVQPLTGLALVAVAVLLAISAGLIRWLTFALSQTPSTQYSVHRTPFLLPGIAAVLLLAALTVAGTPAIAIAIAWFLLIAAEAASWFAVRRPVPPWRGESPALAAARLAATDSPAEAQEELPAGLIQHLTRIRDGDRESIHAVLRATIAGNDRQAAVHIAFCPPLASAPELTAHALDADDAQVRLTQAETFGARLEVRLPATSGEARQVLVELLGSATCY